MTEYTLWPSVDALLEHSHSHTHTRIHLATKQNPPTSTHKPIQEASIQQLQASFKHQFPGHHTISMSTISTCVKSIRGRRTGVSPLNIYIYIYTRIFARAPRALDSPIDHDLGPDPLDMTFGLCWQASYRHAHAILDKAHVQKHKDEDGCKRTLT